MLFNILLIFVFILLNGIFAASEVALISVSETRIQADVDAGKKKAKKVLFLLKNPSKFLSVIQIGITMFGFLNAAIASDAFSADLLAIFLSSSWIDESMTYILQPLITLLITLILTYFQVVLGELVPKRLAMRWPEKTAYLFVGFVNGIRVFMKPFVWLLTESANLIIRLFGINPSEQQPFMTEDELRLMVNASQLKGVIDKSENEMIQNIFEFDSTTVSEVMTHRTEVAAINLKSTKQEVIDFVTSEKYTRFPVYKESIDQIVGILHVKDLLKFLESSSTASQRFSLKRLLRAPYFVPDSKNTHQLFKEMQSKKVHIAVVIDEYGGTAGIVTFEDLIEEIVGNIFDEYDDDEYGIEKTNVDEYEVDGLTDIDEVEDVIFADLPIDEYDTLSGFILGQLGRFPEENESVVIVYNGYKFEVLNYVDKVIERVRISRIDSNHTNETTSQDDA